MSRTSHENGHKVSPPITISLVFHTLALKPFTKKKKSNLNELWLMTGTLKEFSLAFFLQHV